MTEATREGLDAVEELRLRRWARQHFVDEDQRDETWHPVVIDEMQRRDQEHQLVMHSKPYSGIVPLAPLARVAAPMTSAAAGSNLLFRIDSYKPTLTSGADEDSPA